MAGFDAEAVTNLVESLNSHVGEGLSTSGGSLHIDTLTLESDGTVHGGIAELTAKGHAEQFSTTGKNLLDVSTAEIGMAWNGNADSARARIIIPVESGQTYTLSIANANGIDSVYCNTSDNVPASSAGPSFTSKTTFVSQGAYLIVGFNKTDITQSDIAKCGIQLEVGSTATEYEPYTGGAPSPSPDYPQEIQVVRGRNLLELTRLFNAEYYTVNTDGTVLVNSLDTRTWNTLPTFTLSAGTYTISQLNNGVRLRIREVTGGSIGDYILFADNTGVFTFTIDSEKTLAIKIEAVSYPMTSSAIQLELGSVAHPYVPYRHIGMEVQGKNLLDVMQCVNALIIENEAGSTSNSAEWLTTPFIEVEGGSTYTISGYRDGTEVCFWVRLCEYAEDKSLVLFRKNNDISGAASYAKSYTFNSNTKYVRCTFGFNNKPTTISAFTATNRVQLERGDHATPYQPYRHTTTPILLPDRGWVAGLPDGTADSLRIDGAGKVEWKEATEEIVLDGSENWNNKNSGTSNWYHECTQFQTNWPQTTNILVSHYVGAQITNSNTANGLWCVQTANTHDYNIRIRYGTEQSKTDFATWLSTHNVTILYPVENPTTEHAGYVDMPAIPSDATVTIPELDALGIRYFLDDTVTQYGREIIARVKSEYEDRLTALEQAVAELATS